MQPFTIARHDMEEVTQWLDEHGFTPEEAHPVLRSAIEMAEQGQLAPENVMDATAAVLGGHKTKVAEAQQVERYRRWGISAGSTLPLTTSWPSRAAGTVTGTRPTRAPAASWVDFDQALGETLEDMSRERLARKVADHEARRNR